MKKFTLVFVLIILAFSNFASSLSRQGCIPGYNEECPKHGGGCCMSASACGIVVQCAEKCGTGNTPVVCNDNYICCSNEVCCGNFCCPKGYQCGLNMDCVK